MHCTAFECLCGPNFARGTSGAIIRLGTRFAFIAATMMHRPRKCTTSNTADPAGIAERAVGTIQFVDTVSREVTVLLPSGAIVFDVPSDCLILLRGERIKLRMLQPHDEVIAFFVRTQGLFVAQRLEVQPDHGSIPAVSDASSGMGDAYCDFIAATVTR